MAVTDMAGTWLTARASLHRGEVVHAIKWQTARRCMMAGACARIGKEGIHPIPGIAAKAAWP